MTSSGTTIQGHATNFIEELSPGDAIIVFHPTTLHEETKIVRMVLSPISIGISSAFSTDLISTTPFKSVDPCPFSSLTLVVRYIKAPKEELDEEDELKIQRTAEEKKNDLEKAVIASPLSLFPTLAHGPPSRRHSEPMHLPEVNDLSTVSRKPVPMVDIKSSKRCPLCRMAY
jgi:hypothetical protein